MSDHDIQLLVFGATFGMYFMLFLQILYGILDDRRARKARLAAETLLDEAREAAEA
jgi:hypothetical protein